MLRRRQVDQRRGQFRRAVGVDAEAGEFGRQPCRPDAFGDQRGRGIRRVAAADFHRVGDGLAAAPAVLGEKTGDAADGVVGARREVDAAVAVEVDRIAAHARRQELRQADGPGIRALVAPRVAPLVARQQQQGLEFAAEQLGARRMVEGQVGQGIEGMEAPGVAAVEGLDAEDGDDDRGRHAAGRLGVRQRRGVALPEVEAAGDASRLDEAVAIGPPRAAAGIGGRLDGLDDRRIGVRLVEQRQQPVRLETVALHHFGDEAAHVVALAVGRRGVGAGGGETGQQDE